MSFNSLANFSINFNKNTLDNNNIKNISNIISNSSFINNNEIN